MNDDSAQLFDVIIVGGGLSGLMVARHLNSSNVDARNGTGRKIRWKLFEASSRIGGRLQNDSDCDGRSMGIDLGGAWIWPRHQPAIIRSLVNSQKLGIEIFLQPGEDYSYSETMRVVGGAVEFVNKMHDEIQATSNQNEIQTNKAQVQTERPVTAIRRNSDRTITVELANGETFRSSHVVFAVPPRILSSKVSFHPELPYAKSAAMSASETWMAGVTKVALVYKGSPPFWPLVVNQGQRLISPRKGRPAFQVYDGSPYSSSQTNNETDNDMIECNEKISVLTFFTLASLSNQKQDDGLLAKDCAEQMCDSLSASSIRKEPVLDKFIRSYDKFYVKRWPLEPYISHNTDPKGITPHPQPIPELARSEWDGTLLFAGTETDQDSPGVMEGAVGAAFRVTNELSQKFPSLSLE